MKWNSTDPNYLRDGRFYSEECKGTLYYCFWEHQQNVSVVILECHRVLTLDRKSYNTLCFLNVSLRNSSRTDYRVISGANAEVLNSSEGIIH